MVKSNYVQTAPTNGKCASVSGAAAGGHAPISVSAGSSSLGNDFANAPFGSESTMTDSAFRLVDDLAPWTIGDFEILLNPKSPYDIVATNPGQFYYHQRATNTSGGSTNMSFTINWPCQFMTQTNGNGQPIHAYVQLPTDSANTWRDWTPQSSEISWANANVNPPTCNQKGTGPTSGEGKITVNNVPAGAKVWVNVHLDYALKGVGGLGSTFGTPPINYTPFKSKIVSPGGTSSSSGSLLGRGKKVTVVYGRTINRVDGTPLKNVWVRLGTPAKNVLTHTDDYGNYVFYEGQSCTLDGLDSCTGYTGTLTFVNGTTQTPLEIAGKDGTPAAAGSPAYPTGMTNFLITGGGTQFFPAPGTLPGYSTGPPTYTFGIAKNSAYSRNWKFAP